MQVNSGFRSNLGSLTLCKETSDLLKNDPQQPVAYGHSRKRQEKTRTPNKPGHQSDKSQVSGRFDKVEVRQGEDSMAGDSGYDCAPRVFTPGAQCSSLCCQAPPHKPLGR